MANRSIKCADCDNNITITGFNGQDADGKAAYAVKTGRVCSACYKTEQTEIIIDKSAALLPLSGSEKQIAWAMKIRLDLLGDIDVRFAQLMRAEFATDAARTAAVKMIESARSALTSKTEAKWWIDRRDTADTRIIIREVHAELTK